MRVIVGPSGSCAGSVAGSGAVRRGAASPSAPSLRHAPGAAQCSALMQSSVPATQLQRRSYRSQVMPPPRAWLPRGLGGGGSPQRTAEAPAPAQLQQQQQQQQQQQPAAAQPPPTSYKYRSLTKQGNMTSVEVTHTKTGAVIEVVLEGYDLDGSIPPPALHWGMYRASANQWYHPRETVPKGSSLDAASGGMRSPMTWRADRFAWCATLEVPAKLLPLHLALVFFYPERGVYETPARAKYFSIPVGMSAGSAEELGATIMSATQTGSKPEDATCTVNFAVFSRHATAVYLCLVRVMPEQPGATSLQGTGILEIALDPVTNRTGDVWHVCVHGLRNVGLMCYGWRADGDITWETGGRFHPGFILCDPWAARAVPVVLPEAAFTQAPKLLPSYDAKQPVTLASLSCFTQAFEWGGLHRPCDKDGNHIRWSAEEMVALEVDVATFTQGPDAERYVARERRGKFLGILDRMREIVDSGVTSVILSPSCLCAPGLGPWGRNPIAFFAPDPKYAQNGPISTPAELKMVVQALHGAGIEVLLCVEYCITGEGADAMSGGLQGMRGLDSQVYYRALPDRTTVLASGHPVVRSMILASLKHWAEEYALDGFVFVHAENLVQDQFGSILDAPPLPEEICMDPALSGLKLIAAPASQTLLPRAGVRGFPHWGRWMQVNDRFRPDLWSYLVDNTPGLLSRVATRIAGSPDLFAPQWDDTLGLPGCLAAGRRAAFGLNCLMPLGDQPLLQALGSDTDLERAEVMARTLLLTQFASSGVPVVPAATLSRKGLWRFISHLAALRQQLLTLFSPPVTFAPPPATPGAAPPPPLRELKWHGVVPGAEVDWQNALAGALPSNVIAFSLRDPVSGAAVYVALNPYPTAVQVALPGASGGGSLWRLVVDTSRLPPQDVDLDGPLLPATQLVIEVGPKAGVLLLAAAAGATSARGMAPPPPPPPPPTASGGGSGFGPGGSGGSPAPPQQRPTSPVGRGGGGGGWTPPVPAGGVPSMPSRY